MITDVSDIDEKELNKNVEDVINAAEAHVKSHKAETVQGEILALLFAARVHHRFLREDNPGVIQDFDSFVRGSGLLMEQIEVNAERRA